MLVHDTTLTQALAKARFVISQRGKTIGVLLPVAAWRVLLAALEDTKDLAAAADFLKRRKDASSPEEMGMLRWEDVVDEWDQDEEPEE